MSGCSRAAADLYTCSFDMRWVPAQSWATSLWNNKLVGLSLCFMGRVSIFYQGWKQGGRKDPSEDGTQLQTLLGLQNVQRPSPSPILSGPQGRAASPPGAPASRRAWHPSVGSRSAWGHKRASCDRFICADQSSDAQKAHDWNRGESLRPYSRANTFNAQLGARFRSFCNRRVCKRPFISTSLLSSILSSRTLTPPLSPSRTAGPARPSSPSSPLAV